MELFLFGHFARSPQTLNDYRLCAALFCGTNTNLVIYLQHGTNPSTYQVLSNLKIGSRALFHWLLPALLLCTSGVSTAADDYYGACYPAAVLPQLQLTATFFLATLLIISLAVCPYYGSH
ncbi:putative UDP-sugar transporter protein SLC35A4 [Plecturocebus cupreus]